MSKQAHRNKEVMAIALRVIQKHINYRASIAPNGEEIWYFDRRLGGKKQFSQQQCAELVADLYG